MPTPALPSSDAPVTTLDYNRLRFDQHMQRQYGIRAGTIAARGLLSVFEQGTLPAMPELQLGTHLAVRRKGLDLWMDDLQPKFVSSHYRTTAQLHLADTTLNDFGVAFMGANVFGYSDSSIFIPVTDWSIARINGIFEFLGFGGGLSGPGEMGPHLMGVAGQIVTPSAKGANLRQAWLYRESDASTNNWIMADALWTRFVWSQITYDDHLIYEWDTTSQFSPTYRAQEDRLESIANELGCDLSNDSCRDKAEEIDEGISGMTQPEAEGAITQMMERYGITEEEATAIVDLYTAADVGYQTQNVPNTELEAAHIWAHTLGDISRANLGITAAATYHGAQYNKNGGWNWGDHLILGGSVVVANLGTAGVRHSGIVESSKAPFAWGMMGEEIAIEAGGAAIVGLSKNQPRLKQDLYLAARDAVWSVKRQQALYPLTFADNPYTDKNKRGNWKGNPTLNFMRGATIHGSGTLVSAKASFRSTASLVGAIEQKDFSLAVPFIGTSANFLILEPTMTLLLNNQDVVPDRVANSSMNGGESINDSRESRMWGSYGWSAGYHVVGGGLAMGAYWVSPKWRDRMQKGESLLQWGILPDRMAQVMTDIPDHLSIQPDFAGLIEGQPGAFARLTFGNPNIPLMMPMSGDERFHGIN